eukprot:TRINITY_DN954_c0_g1_i3.p1 TRINITY_DN954_c0_g1~~TRINITY_DN954_c0_g1_i3.p1  ORF type:complete len:232 (-),score=53.47 TRINITY_DN954_c0_g1_i3:75-770(-)
MSLFSGYDSDLHAMLPTLRESIQAINSKETPDRNAAIANAQADLKTAKDLLEKLEFHADDEASTKRVAQCRAELKPFETDIRKAILLNNDNLEREMLMSGKEKEMEMTSRNQQDKFSRNTRKLMESDDYIETGVITLNNSIQELSEANRNLVGQRSTMDRSRTRLGGINDSLTSAFRKVRSISARMTSERLIMIGMVLALVATMAIIIYFKFIYDPNAPSPSPTPNNSTRF